MPIPVRIISTGANVTAGLGHRSLGPFDGLTVVGSERAITNVAGGVVPMSASEYTEIFRRYLSNDGLSPAAWFRAGEGQTVTGSGVSQWSDQSGNARHLLQGTDSARPVSLLHEGTNYLYLPGVAGNYASTPDSAAASITGDIDIRVRVALADWTPSANNTLVAKYIEATNKRSYMFRVTTLGRLELYTSNNGTADVLGGTSTLAPTVSDGAAIWVRATLDVNDGSGNRVCTFYTAADSATEPTSWTQLGNVITTAGTTSINDNDAPLLVGALNATTGHAACKLYRAIIKNGIDGTTVVDFNPADASDQAASFASSTTGETWTINSTGSLPAQIVGRSSILTNGSSHVLKCSGFTLNQPACVIAALKQISWTLNDVAWDGNTAGTMQLLQSATTPRIRANAGSSTTENAGLAVGVLGIVVASYNGASSFTRINNNANVTGDAGAGNAGGFTLGANGTPSAFFNGQYYEALVLASTPTTTQLDRIVRYMAGKYGVAL